MMNCRQGIDCSFVCKTADELFKVSDSNEEPTVRYSSGIKGIDDLLLGGFGEGEIIEIAGPSGCGKSQIALTFCSKFVQAHNSRILYIDTVGGFSAFRLTEMILKQSPKLKEHDVNRLLSKMVRVTAASFMDLLEILEGVRQNLNSIRNNLNVVIIDHVGTLLSPLLSETKTLGFARMKLAGRLLKILSRDFKITILVVNQTVQISDVSARPSLGQNWLSVPDLTILIDPQLPATMSNKGFLMSPNYSLKSTPNRGTIHNNCGGKYLTNCKLRETCFYFVIEDDGAKSYRV